MLDKKRKIAIIGAGDLGQQIANLARKNDIDVVAFFDDRVSSDTFINKIPVVGKISDILKNKHLFSHIVVGIGYKHFDFRESIYNHFYNELEFATIIDKSVIIDPSVKIGHGTIIMPGSIIDMNVIIEDNVFINIGSTIAHDSKIGSHSFIAPRVAIAGYTKIGKKTFIGLNSTIIDNLNLPDEVFIGGGTVVIDNLIGKGAYVGNPARKIR